MPLPQRRSHKTSNGWSNALKKKLDETHIRSKVAVTERLMISKHTRGDAKVENISFRKCSNETIPCERNF